MIVGVGFKLSVVPFHMWAADVYEGAPAPVTAFIATVSKGGMIALLVRFFEQVEGNKYQSLAIVFHNNCDRFDVHRKFSGIASDKC